MNNAQLRQELIGAIEAEKGKWFDVSYQLRMNEGGDIEIRNASYERSNDEVTK